MPLALAGVALVARLAYWRSVADRHFLSDASTYHEIASYLAAGEGFSHTYPHLVVHATAFRPPVFPFVLSLVYRLFGASAGVGQAFAVAVGVALVVTTYFVVRRHADATTGAVTALLVALFPPLIANDVVPLTESLSLILVLLLADATLRGRWATAGLWCGLLMLTRPSAQFLVLVIAGWFVAKVGWRRAALVLAVTAVVVAPWVVRNRVVVGNLGIVSSNGFNLAAIYSPEAQADGQFVDASIDARYERLRLAQFDEATWDAELRAVALANLRADPWQVFAVVRRNTVGLLELHPGQNSGAEHIDGRNPTVRAASLPMFYAVFVAGAIGLVRARRRPVTVLLSLIGAYFALSSIVLVSPPRLRAPVDLVLCFGVGLLVADVRRRHTARELGADEGVGAPPVITRRRRR